MSMLERTRARRARWHALAFACVALASRPAAAQDPPPPMLPGDAPPETPPQPRAPDTPPRPDAPPSPPGAVPPAPPIPPPAAPAEPPVPIEPITPQREHRAPSARMLKGYVFQTPALVDSAFTQTHVGLGVELGHQSDFGATLGTTKQFDRSFGVTTGYLAAGVSFLDRFELGLTASYSSLLANDVTTTLLYGGQNAWSVRPGLRIRVFRSTSTGSQLAVHAYGDFSGGSHLSPGGLLAEIAAEAPQIAGDTTRTGCLAAGDVSCIFKSAGFDPNAATQFSRTQLGGGATLSYAQAIGSMLGLQAAMGFEVGHGSVTTPPNATLGGGAGNIGSTPVNFHIGLAPSIDFGPTVPIGVMAEYQFTFVDESFNPPSGGNLTGDAGTLTSLQHGFSVGVYYTGRRELQLGALFGATLIKSSVNYSGSSDPTATSTSVDQPPTTLLTGQITARYFF